MKCRHCGKKLEKPKIRISIIKEGNTNYYYYPDDSYTDDIGGMKMMIEYIDKLQSERVKFDLEVKLIGGFR